MPMSAPRRLQHRRIGYAIDIVLLGENKAAIKPALLTSRA